MGYTRETAIARLLKSYEAYYDVHLFEDEQIPITARCDFFEHSQKYVISRKAELWSADCEEFLYLLDIPHLTFRCMKNGGIMSVRTAWAACMSARGICTPLLLRCLSVITVMRMRERH